MDVVKRAEAQSVRRMFEDGLSTDQIARRSGRTRAVVRGYLRHAYAEPLETRLLWHRAWRSQVRTAMLKAGRYWRGKHRAARTTDAKADVLQEYAERLRELELHV